MRKERLRQLPQRAEVVQHRPVLLLRLTGDADQLVAVDARAAGASNVKQFSNWKEILKCNYFLDPLQKREETKTPEIP